MSTNIQLDFEIDKKEVDLRQRRIIGLKLSGSVIDGDYIDHILQQVIFWAEKKIRIVLVLGAGDQFSKILGERILDDDGDRITDPKKIYELLYVANNISEEIVKKMKSISSDVEICIAPNETVLAKRKGNNTATGRKELSFDEDSLSDIKNSSITIIGNIGIELGVGPVNMNADTLAGGLMKRLSSDVTDFIIKVKTNGIVDKNGETISVIPDMDTVKQLIKNGIITDGARPKVLDAMQLFEETNIPTHIMPENIKGVGHLMLRETLTSDGCDKATMIGYRDC